MDTNTFIRNAIRPFVHLFARPRAIIGLEYLPKHGPFILAIGPHKTYGETLVVAASLARYELRFMAKASLWRIPLLGPLLTSGKQISVTREAGVAGGAIAPAVKALVEGGILAIYPEGKTYKSDAHTHRGKTGVVRIALAANEQSKQNIPIIPVGLVGMRSEDRKLGGRVIVIGEPIHMPMFVAKIDQIIERRKQETLVTRRLTDQLMRTLAKLSSTHYVG